MGLIPLLKEAGCGGSCITPWLLGRLRKEETGDTVKLCLKNQTNKRQEGAWLPLWRVRTKLEGILPDTQKRQQCTPNLLAPYAWTFQLLDQGGICFSSA